MPQLVGKNGKWDLPHVDTWKDRSTIIKFERKPLISSKTYIATIGSCFAGELASAFVRLGLNGARHPNGQFYNTSSIRQEIDRAFGGWEEYAREPYWNVEKGFVHPFKSYSRIFSTKAELHEWSDKKDRESELLFRKADVIVITLGMIESWKDPERSVFYRQIPHPDIFNTLGAIFHRLTVDEMIKDLKQIRSIIRRNTNAEIILTVSPIPLCATLTNLDVQVANIESKSRIRAAVSEFTALYPDVSYFHSYEIVMTAERLNDFMLEDGRHVNEHAVDYILQQFLKVFACDDLNVPDIDESWLAAHRK